MTVTDNQLILALVCGVTGILAAFMPFIAVMSKHFFDDNSRGGDGTSIFSFLVQAIAVQLIVGIFFNGIVRALDATLKGGLKVLGEEGGFDLFWKIQVIYATQMSQTVTALIVIIRDMTVLINAFIPIAAVLGGILAGYKLANNQKHTEGSNYGHSDFLNYGTKMFAGAFIAGIVYFGWAQIASYALYLPSAISGEKSTLVNKSNEYWRQALGMGGKPASEIIIQ